MTKITETPLAGPLTPSDAFFVGQGGDLVSHGTMEQLIALIQQTGTEGKKTAPPIVGDFATIINASNGGGNTTTFVQKPGKAFMNVNGVSHNLATVYLALKLPPQQAQWSATARLKTGMPDVNYTHFGLVIYDVNSKRLVVVGHTGGVGLECNHWTFDNSLGSPSSYVVNAYLDMKHSGTQDYTVRFTRNADGSFNLLRSIDDETFYVVLANDTYLSASAIGDLRIGFGVFDEYHLPAGASVLTDMSGSVFFYEDDTYPAKNFLFNPASLDFNSVSTFPKNLHKPQPSDFSLRARARGGLEDVTVIPADAGGIELTGTTGTNDAGGSARGSYYAMRSIPLAYQAGFEFAAYLDGFVQNHDNSNYGIAIADDAGNSYHVGVGLVGGSIKYYISGWNATTSAWYDFSFGTLSEDVRWFKIAFDNTGALTTSFSRDGLHWVVSELSTSSPTDTLAHVNLGTPTKYGFYIARYDAGAPKLFIPYFYSSEFPRPKGVMNQPLATSWGIRLRTSNDAGYCSVAQLELRETPNVPQVVSLSAGQGYADRSYFGLGSIPNAFDADDGNRWASGVPYLNNRLWYTFASPKRIKQVAIHYSDGERLTGFDVIVSNDNMATFTVVASVDAINVATAYGPGSPFLLNIPPIPSISP